VTTALVMRSSLGSWNSNVEQRGTLGGRISSAG
jgi:hypothetical protein